MSGTHRFVYGDGTYPGPPEETCSQCGKDPRNDCHKIAEELCYFCNAEPGGKYGIGERCRTERFKIYEIRPLASSPGNIDFTLSHVHREVIRFLGEHSGESFYEWALINRTDDESLRQDYQRYGEPFIDHVKRLITMGFVTERVIIGQTRVLLRLTEWGFKVYEQIKNQLNIIGINTPLPKG